MIIVLMGYMGSGKSLIGSHLSKVIDFDYIDLDDYISEKEASSISELFENKGEIFFRKIETKYLKELLDKKSNLVISLGGGTPCYSNNLELILRNDTIQSFYLKASILTLTERLISEKSKRPLLSHISSKSEIQEFIGKHLFERSQFYSQSNYTIVTDNKSVEAIIEDILFHLI
ncbi:MAG: shikimate kinase [Winogradskyella sp.]|uniref:shikimate kinase n=1 Tax=Winogradskyella sp. TaxID=1883156 RepID=UPI000F3B71C2|nr:shikimate kinase [Winogradskyella sp.]RNC80161.1 MAG: shikimate kinase [Winogradskyella sp.]